MAAFARADTASTSTGAPACTRSHNSGQRNSGQKVSRGCWKLLHECKGAWVQDMQVNGRCSDWRPIKGCRTAVACHLRTSHP
jgi:hypothetical protein